MPLSVVRRIEPVYDRIYIFTYNEFGDTIFNQYAYSNSGYWIDTIYTQLVDTITMEMIDTFYPSKSIRKFDPNKMVVVFKDGHPHRLFKV